MLKRKTGIIILFCADALRPCKEISLVVTFSGLKQHKADDKVPCSRTKTVHPVMFVPTPRFKSSTVPLSQHVSLYKRNILEQTFLEYK